MIPKGSFPVPSQKAHVIVFSLVAVSVTIFHQPPKCLAILPRCRTHRFLLGLLSILSDPVSYCAFTALRPQVCRLFAGFRRNVLARSTAISLRDKTHNPAAFSRRAEAPGSSKGILHVFQPISTSPSLFPNARCSLRDKSTRLPGAKAQPLSPSLPASVLSGLALPHVFFQSWQFFTFATSFPTTHVSTGQPSSSTGTHENL